MITSDQINELADALSKAQPQFKGAAKDANNPFLNKKYADLASVWDAIKEPLAGAGLSVVQGCSYGDGMVVVTSMLLHKSGQWVRTELALPLAPDKAGVITPQTVGSAITYGRRYTLMALVGVCPEDDDGQQASKQPQQQTSNQPGQQSKRQPQQSQAQPADELDRLVRAISGAFAQAQKKGKEKEALEIMSGQKAWKEDLPQARLVMRQLAELLKG